MGYELITLDELKAIDEIWDQELDLSRRVLVELYEEITGERLPWYDYKEPLQHVKEELADVMVYSQNLLDKLGLDADEIVNMKMSQNEAKYPVEKAKGNAAKYDQL